MSRIWEHRRTAALESLKNHPIIKALVRDRSDHTEGTRDVSNLTSGVPVWVLAHQHDHRGGTWFDEEERVVWLVGYAIHRSGEPNDFFQWIKNLDQKDQMLPTEGDYNALMEARDQRLATRILIEAPLILRDARISGGEITGVLGGKLGISVSVQYVEELEQVFVSAVITTPSFYRYFQATLVAMTGDAKWEQEYEGIPGRERAANEVVFSHIGTRDV